MFFVGAPRNGHGENRHVEERLSVSTVASACHSRCRTHRARQHIQWFLAVCATPNACANNSTTSFCSSETRPTRMHFSSVALRFVTMRQHICNMHVSRSAPVRSPGAMSVAAKGKKYSQWKTKAKTSPNKYENNRKLDVSKKTKLIGECATNYI